MQHRRALRRRRPRLGSPCARRGVIVMELLLNLPIWLIGLLAVLEFGELVSNLQQLAVASRAGADMASQTSGLSTVNGDPIPPAVYEAVENQLTTSGILKTPFISWNVFLEHNVAAGGGTLGTPVVLRSGPGSISPLELSPPPTPASPPTPTVIRYVRVTVIVPATSLAPDVLNTFGLNMSVKNVDESTTFQYKL